MGSTIDSSIHFSYVLTFQMILRKEVLAILEVYHSNPTCGGHFGMEKTLKKITERYYWRGIKKDVTDYCKNCHKCCCHNNTIQNEKPPLQNIPIPCQFWSMVGIDTKRK